MSMYYMDKQGRIRAESDENFIRQLRKRDKQRDPITGREVLVLILTAVLVALLVFLLFMDLFIPDMYKREGALYQPEAVTGGSVSREYTAPIDVPPSTAGRTVVSRRSIDEILQRLSK